MHTNADGAPKAGSLVYYIDENKFDSSLKDHTFAVVHDATAVKLVQVNNPHVSGVSVICTDYVEGKHRPDLKDAIRDAIKRVKDRKAQLDNTLTALQLLFDSQLIIKEQK